MGKIVVTEFVSLDGVMQAPGGEDFKYKGWSFEFDRGEDGNQFKLDETMEADALLLGRKTYESFAGAWPDARGRVRRQVQRDAEVPRVVDAHGPRLEQHDRLEGDLIEAVRKLRDEFDGVIQVPGAARWYRTCLRTTSWTRST